MNKNKTADTSCRSHLCGSRGKGIRCLFLRSTHVAVGKKGNMAGRVPVATSCCPPAENNAKQRQTPGGQVMQERVTPSLCWAQLWAGVSAAISNTPSHCGVSLPVAAIFLLLCCAPFGSAGLGCYQHCWSCWLHLAGERGKTGLPGCQLHTATAPVGSATPCQCPFSTMPQRHVFTSPQQHVPQRHHRDGGGEEKRTGCRGWIHRCCADILQLERTRKKGWLTVGRLLTPLPQWCLDGRE